MKQATKFFGWWLVVFLALLVCVVAPMTAFRPANSALTIEEPLRIVVVGDSISCGGQADTAGWCPELSRLLTAAGVEHVLIPRAVGGTRCDYWAENINEILYDTAPDVVILGCGTNDGAAQRTALQVQQAIETVAYQVAVYGAQLLTGVPSYSSGQPTDRLWLPEAQHEAYNGIRAAGLFPMFDDTRMPALLRFQIGDGVHPTPEGYKVLAHNRYNALSVIIQGLPPIPPDCMQIGHAPGEPAPLSFPCYGVPKLR